MFILKVILAALLLFFLPGFTLVNVLFPRKKALDKEFDLLYRIGFGMATSVVIVVLLGFLLGRVLAFWSEIFLFKSFNMLVGLTGLTILFFFLGASRGAYPWMVVIHPKFSPDEIDSEPDYMEEEREEKEVLNRLQGLVNKRERLKSKIKNAEGKKKKELEDKLERVNRELKEAEERRAEDIAG